MALTPFRWIAALIAGCLIVAVAILRNGPSPRLDNDLEKQLEFRVNRYASRAAVAATRLRLAQLLDSTGTGIAQTGGASSIRVFHSTALPLETRAALDSLGWRAVRHVREAGQMGIDVVFLYDTVKSVRGAPVNRRYDTHVDYVLPRRADERCVAIAQVGKGATTRGQIVGVFQTDAAAVQLVGPCAYYRAFGIPGPRVEAWLRDRAWSFVGGGTWNQRAPQVDLSSELRWRNSFPLESMLVVETSLVFLAGMSIDGVQCASGELDACDHAVQARRSLGAPGFWNGNVLYRSYPTLGWQEYASYRAFGRREPSLLADMVRTLGRERFARFWTSNESVPAAFEAVAGEPLNRWTVRWMGAQYGPVPPRGAGVTTWGGAMSLILVVLAILVALRVSAQRQFV